MAPESCTIEEYLSRPYPSLSIETSENRTLTVNANWDPIEGVTPWLSFNYEDLSRKFRQQLKKKVNPHDAAWMVKQAGLIDIFGEDTVTISAFINTFFPVSNCLSVSNPGFHTAPGSKFFRQQADGSPDWGFGHREVRNEGLRTLLNYLPADLKTYSKWNSDNIMDLNRDDYMYDAALKNKALPLEQCQHYCISLGTQYSYVLTEMEILVIRFSYSAEPPYSPKPSREASHRRVFSNASAPFSDMSIDPSDHSMYSAGSSGRNPAPLEFAQFPYSSKKGSKMTPNLALYFLCLLAIEERNIPISSPPLPALSQTEGLQQQRVGPNSSFAEQREPASSQSQSGPGGYNTTTTYSHPASTQGYDQDTMPVNVQDPSKTTSPRSIVLENRNYIEVTLLKPGADITSNTYSFNTAKGRVEKLGSDFFECTNSRGQECMVYYGQKSNEYYWTWSLDPDSDYVFQKSDNVHQSSKVVDKSGKRKGRK